MRRGKGTSPTPEDGNERHWALRSLQRLGNELGSFRGIFTLAGPFAVIVGFLVALLFPELRQMGLSILALGAIAVLSLALAWLLRPHNRVARRRQRYGMTATVSVLAVVGIVSLVNLLAVNNNVLVDVTASRQYSLAPQTLNVLTERVQGQIEATAFIVEDQDPLEAVTTDRMEEYLREFARQSGGSFSYRVVDPERFPDIANRSGVTQWPIVVFEEVGTGKRQSVPATANPEQDFLTALLVVSGLSQKTIYILDGYSPWEPSNLDADARHGFGFASRGLTGDGYAVRTLNLVQNPSVPDDAAAVVVAGPARDLGATDAAALNEYLEGGGRMLALLEPDPPRTWRDLIARWGIDVLDGYVIDLASHVAGTPATPLVGQGSYIATDVAPQMDLTFYPGLAPLWVIRPPEEMPSVLELKPLAVVSDRSFATEDPETPVPLAADVLGPFMVGLVVRAQGPVDQPTPSGAARPTTTLAVFGDTDFASNPNFLSFSNGDLFLNVMNYVTGDEALISVRPKPVVFREMAMTPREFNFVRYTGWFLLPLLVTIAGFIAWWRRR